LNTRLSDYAVQRLAKPTVRFVLSLAVALLSVAAGAPECRAADFNKALLFIEHNATAGDGGIQGFIDANNFQSVRILNTDGYKILELNVKRGLKQLGGLAEMGFESVEPTLAEVLEKFPEGEYTFVGKTVEGSEVLMGTAKLSHDLPDEPTITDVSPGDPLPTCPSSATIDWTPPGVIDRQQVIITNEMLGRQLTVDLPSTVMSLTVPSFFDVTGTLKVEVLAIASNGNRTISECTITTP
jgi:hypothetical protein